MSNLDFARWAQMCEANKAAAALCVRYWEDLIIGALYREPNVVNTKSTVSSK